MHTNRRPAFQFHHASLFGRWIRSQRPFPAAVAELGLAQKRMNMTKPRSFAVAAIAIPVALAAGCSTTDLAHSKAASPQKNEIPVVQLPQIPDNATPKTGSVVEYWPDGRKKSDRQYKDGRMLRAIFYSSDGKKVYEMEETVGGQ